MEVSKCREGMLARPIRVIFANVFSLEELHVGVDRRFQDCAAVWAPPTRAYMFSVLGLKGGGLARPVHSHRLLVGLRFGGSWFFICRASLQPVLEGVDNSTGFTITEGALVVDGCYISS